MSDTTNHSDHSIHILPITVYVKVYVALLALLFLTVWVAFRHIPIQAITVGIALTIAVIKAVMVILYFMHVRFQSRLTWLWAGAGFVWLLILFGVIMDYISRPWVPVGHGW